MQRSSTSNSHESGTTGNVFPIVFATDDNYAPYAGVAIRSIISNADPRNTYRIFILYSSLSEEHIEALEGLSTENVTVRCRYIVPSMSGVRSPLPELRYISMETYYRILIPEIEEFKAYPYVLYLDCDLIVNTDITGIVPQSMGDNLIVGVRDNNMTIAVNRESVLKTDMKRA